MTLNFIHFLYIGLILFILGTLLVKKEIVLPCIIAIFAIGFSYSGDLIFSIQTLYNTLIYSGNEFWGIIVVISLVVAMSHSLQDIGADTLIMSPLKKLMVNGTCTFFTLGFTMLIISWLVWPSPAVALMGTIMVPAAIKAGLPAIWVAVAINLFGHGIALSSDFFIQAAPTITAKGAGLPAIDIIRASLPIWLTMSTVTVFVAYMMYRRDRANPLNEQFATIELENTPLSVAPKKYAKFIAIITPTAYLLDVFAMWKLGLAGGDATALIGGTTVLLMVLISVLNFGITDALEKSVDYLKIGFAFGIKVFTPVIFIGGFFFLGNESIAKSILGANATGLLNDISLYMSQNIPITKTTAVLTQSVVAFITGLDGSGFSGLPITGSLAYTFSTGVSMSTATLASLGQIITIWVDGGTIIPWAVIPVAAICGVDPGDLVRKNLIPVLCGIAATIIVTILIV